MPNPNGPLSDNISSKTIELANAAIEKVSHLSKDKKAHVPRSTPHLILSPAQRFEVGQRATKHGVTSALYWSKNATGAKNATGISKLHSLVHCRRIAGHVEYTL